MRVLLAVLILATLAPVAGAQPPTEETQTAEAPAGNPDEMQTAATEDSALGDDEKSDDEKSDDEKSADNPEDAPPPLLDKIPLREFLVLPRVDVPGRRVLHQDPIDAAMARGEWRPPQAGDVVTAAGGDELEWEIAVADYQGRLSGPATSGGYAFATVNSPIERTMILQATHAVSVCVNGAWLAGDLYGYGGPHLPVRLKAGENHLLFHVAQPGFTATLVKPPRAVRITTEDATLPDIIQGESNKLWAALPIVNASEDRLAGGELRVTIGNQTETTSLASIEPMTIYKAPLRLPAINDDDDDDGDGPVAATVALHLPRGGGALAPDATATLDLMLQRAAPTELHTRTFLSNADGSVQSYSVLPASAPIEEGEAGIILALHDLGVDHRQFAGYFKPKPWAHVVAPQNRRPVGFAWEDWGAGDAIEALEDAAKRLDHDPRRVSVTGHGYGGYGALRLALRLPDRFAAVGMSGASVEFFSDPGPAPENLTPIDQMLRRGGEARATAGLLRNLSNTGVFLLHGTDDQRSPPAGSRFLRARLGDFHSDFAYYERPGAGHWWGPEGVDWPRMIDFFEARRLPEPRDVRRVDFTTAHPADASRCHWAGIERQEVPFEPARVEIDHDPEEMTFAGRTENVALLSLELAHLGGQGRVTITLDDSPPLRPAFRGRAPRLWLAKNDEGEWKVTRRPPPAEKNAARGGRFKSAWDHRALLVYGTKGSNEENEWAEAKARYDAQSFWRRGNGAIEVIPDTDFDSTTEPNRSVILYGNADSNAAWPALLSTSPVQVRSGRVEVTVQANMRPELGDDLTVLMVRPRPGSRVASVAVVAGTGPVGMRAADRLRYFVPGVAYPDFLLMGAGVLTDGERDVRATGYFGPDWGAGSGEVVWRDLAL